MSKQSYFLRSDRLGFRKWTFEDLPLARQLWGDPQVTRLFSKEPLSDKQVEDRLKAEIEGDAAYCVQYWPIFELSTGDFVGCCGLRPYKPDENIYELGSHLCSSQWGKGYATEAARAVMKYAMEDRAMAGIFAGHHPDNTASRNVLLKLGFKQTGTEFYEPTGLMHPSYLFKKEEHAGSVRSQCD